MYKLFIVTLLFLVSVKCANKSTPTGGVKDEVPPLLIESSPKNKEKNVTSTEISLLFDELIVAKRIKKELIITPQIDFEYDYKIKNKKITLILEKTLDSITTYTFNFRKSIQDITEGNPSVDLSLVFSTGPFIDTLELTGSILDLFTEKTQSELFVGLYKLNDSISFFKNPPYYLSKTDEYGKYHFKNIKKGSYRLFSFFDKNNNLICETSTEPYAFISSTIRVDSNLTINPLKLQLLNTDSLALKKAAAKGKYFVFNTSKYITSLALRAENDSTLWYSFNEEKKVFKIYNTFPIQDSLKVYLMMMDSLNIQKKDSFYLSFPETKRKYDDYSIELKKIKVFPESKKISFQLNTSKPSPFIYPENIHITIQEDTTSNIKFDSAWNVTINKNSTLFTFSNYLPSFYLDSINTEKKKPLDYNLFIPSATFISVESDSSKEILEKINPLLTKNFGKINGTIKTKYSYYFVQLLDENYSFISEVASSSFYSFQYIKPGDYFIRVLVDTNKNGKWDGGNIFLNQQPEPCFIYENNSSLKKITVRANWEINLDLTF